MLFVAWCASAGCGQGCSGQRACLFTEFLQQGVISLVRAGNFGEVRGMVARGPLVEGMGAVPGGVDRGEAAASAVDDVACGGEREGRHRDAESRGRGEQAGRRVAAAGERPGLLLPDHGRVDQQRVLPEAPVGVPLVVLRLADQGRRVFPRHGDGCGQRAGPRGDDVGVQDPDPRGPGPGREAR